LLQNLRITFALNEADENDPVGRNIQAANLPPKSICNDFFTAWNAVKFTEIQLLIAFMRWLFVQDQCELCLF